MLCVSFILLIISSSFALAKPWEEVGAISTPTPTPTSTTTSTPTTTTTTVPLNPCPNGCIVTIGTADGPIRPPPYFTDYNGGNPMITSFPITQP